MGPDASKQTTTCVDDATPRAPDEERARMHGGLLPRPTSPAFRRTKMYLVFLAFWGSLGPIVAFTMMEMSHSGLDDFVSSSYTPCTVPYFIVAVLLMWAYTASFLKEA